ncbi:AraC family transcriptional regulator [Paracoccus sp. p4-l81]|uniref:AraC family transcriptional regulator n=1 Tax=Paracoccus sp. p4-l81 TaxID=3342806 RepID=UPI0035B85F97
MQGVGDLIGLCRLQGSLDVRCHMSGPCFVDHDPSPPGEAAFHVVLSGSVRIDLPGAPPLVAGAGSLLLLPRGVGHRLRNADCGTGPARLQRNPGLFAPEGAGRPELDLLCGRFAYDRLVGPMLFEGLPDILHLHPDVDSGELDAIITLIRREAEARSTGAVEIVTSLTTVLFVLALRQSLDLPGLGGGVIALLADRALAPAVLAMYQAPDRNWTVASLAEQVAMSRATFARRFSERAGRGPAETLLMIRCQLAVQMLQRTDRSVADIAHDLGYSCDISFGKAFARQMGMTPSTARRRYAMAAAEARTTARA